MRVVHLLIIRIKNTKKKSTIHVVRLSCHKYSTVSLSVFLYKGTSRDVYFLFSFGEGGGGSPKILEVFCTLN